MLDTDGTVKTVPAKRKLEVLWKNIRQSHTDFGKLLVVLVGCFLGIILAIAQTDGLTRGQNSSVDPGWQMALAYTLQHGQIVGRDVFFTYGPISQLTHWIATLFTVTHSAFDSYSLMVVINRLLSLISLAAILMLIPRIHWKYTAVVFLGCILLDIVLQDFYYRSYFLVLAGILFARSLAARTRRRRLVGIACYGLCALLLQLVTFEMGIYAILAALTICGILMLLSWRQWFRPGEWLPVRELAWLLGTMLAVYLVSNLLLSLLFKLTSADYKSLFDYQVLSLEIVRGYNYTFGTPWSLSNIGTWVLALVTLYTVGMVIWYCKKLAIPEVYLLFSLLIVSLFELKSALIRSDIGHIPYASIPVLLLFLLLGYDWLNSGKPVKLLWASLLLGLVISWPLASLAGFQTLGQVFDGQISITSRVKHLLEQNTPSAKIVPEGLLEATDPTKAVLTFPYEYYYGIGLKKKVISPVIQSYSAHTLKLQQYFTDSIASNKANLEIIYGLDGIISDAIDGVQNITRLPGIFEYIYNNFDLKTPELYGKGYMLLKARPERYDMASTALPFTTGKTAPNFYTYRFSQPTSCSMIRLTSKVDYPTTAMIGRPNNFLVSFWSKGAKFLESGMVTIEPGKPFSTYISLVDPSRFSDYFSSRPVQTKPLDAIQIQPKETGLFGVNPSSFELAKLECISFER